MSILSGQTTKQKLDQLLGIESNQSIDAFLDTLDADTSSINNTLSSISTSVKENIEHIDTQLEKIKENKNIAPTILTDLNSSMKEVEELIQLSKQMYKHIYSSIVTTDLIDSELIVAASKLLESIHLNTSEFITMYRDRQRYIEHIQILTFQQEQRKELLRLKHQYDMEKIRSKNDANTIDTENEVSYSFSNLIQMLDKIKKEEAEPQTTE